jgi:hypothetical protein
MKPELTDEHRLAVIAELWERQAQGLRWTPIYSVIATYEREARERQEREVKR